MGAIGSYLSEVLSSDKINIRFYDTRVSQEHAKKIPLINSFSNFKKRISVKSIGKNEDLIIVCLKSYDIDEKLISELEESKKEVLFLQNGISLYMNQKNKSEYFHFGTIFGIQANLLNGILKADTQDCTLVIKKAKKSESIKKLNLMTRKKNLNIVVTSRYDELILQKFIRWLVVSSITSLCNAPLGKSLDLIPLKDINQAVVELSKMIKNEFFIEISPESVIKKINSLPMQMTTSAHQDYIMGKESEMIIELKKVIDQMNSYGEDPAQLKKWWSKLNNEK